MVGSLFFILGLIGLVVFIVFCIIYKDYESFVLNHSILLKNVKKVNSKYNFNTIKSFHMKHSYDNEDYFNNVSPKDYLTYQLQFIQYDVKKNIRDVFENLNNYDLYVADIKDITCFYNYDVDVTKKFRKLLQNIENKLYDKSLLKPIIDFRIKVDLVLTNINGSFKRSKHEEFNVEIIEDIIYRLNDKYNGRFNDKSIWDSVSIVERAKVSNKMRFAVYKKDNNRCVKCGSRYNLEVDHIMPIAKGGKTTFNNLQTLCKRCNGLKSDTIEGYNNKTYNPNIRYCVRCKAPLRIKNGKYGKFYGCSNFPKCNYTEKE